MAEWNEPSHSRSGRRLPFNPDPSRDINILLLGETGVGKSTFINAFFHYLVHDTLDAALQGEMQVLIPSAFSVSDGETHNQTTITMGTRNKNELCEENGQSQTQGCKSYLFSIGDRYLRFIDTPGVGDCRGVQQDNDNFEHILAFISRYEHLNGICILLKPNDHRLGISFRYIIRESLKHLSVSAKDNIMFVFTNARTNFFTPGATANQLRILLNQIEQNGHEPVPFHKKNTFLFDNEGFRFLGVCKAGHHFFDAQKSYFVDSWNKSVAELTRMMARIMECGLHAVRDMETLNEAYQLIRKLPRPIGEVATLIQENIQLAEEHKKKVIAKEKDVIPHQIPEKKAEIVSLPYPRTICASKTCSTVTEVDGEMKIDYKANCHEHCHLKGVEQEVIKNPALKHCRAMSKRTGKCKRCGCEWIEHMHVTYEFKKHLAYREIDEKSSSRSSERILSRIDQHIADLKQEQDIIRHICAKLTLFLQVNSINPTNEDVIGYIEHFIQEEKQKFDAGGKNKEVIRGLEKMIKEYQNEIQLLKSNVSNKDEKSDVPTIEEIFVFKCQLCELPITGKYMTEQIDRLNINRVNRIEEQDEYVELPFNAQYSKNMKQFKQVTRTKSHPEDSNESDESETAQF